MLLTKLRERLRRTTEESERGTVIISVIVVGSIVLIVCSLIAASAVTALTFTSDSRGIGAGTYPSYADSGITSTGSRSGVTCHRGHSTGRVRAKLAETTAFWKNEPALYVSGSASSSTMPLARRVDST